MPQVALGTGYHGALPVPEAIEHAHNATMKWLSQGGEHVDTAHWYTDEPGVGSGWKASGLDRKDIFLTTKMPSALGREAVLEYFANSTRDLQTDYIDLYLLHTPSMPQGNGQQTPTQCGVNVSWASCRVETWAAMEELYRSGKVRAIGVSNWAIQHLNDILPTASIAPMVNQLELHPFLPNTVEPALPGFCAKNGIAVMSYSPLAGGAGPGRSRNATNSVGPRLFADPEIKAIAESTRATVSQVVLAWHRALEYFVVVRSENSDHMAEDLGQAQVDLDMGEMKMISSLPDLGLQNGSVWHWDIEALP